MLEYNTIRGVIFMCQKINHLNNIIKEVASVLNIKIDNYNIDDIHKMLINNKLYDCLENTFKNCDYVDKRILSMCNKFQYDLIKMYLELNKIEIKEIQFKST